MDKRGGGSIKIFRQNFSVSQCRKIPQGNPLLLHQFRVSKKFGKEEGGGVSRYSVENFLSHSAENFRRRILFCCIIFGYRKSLDKRGEGRIKIFHRKFFVSVPKISVGKSFSDSLISGTENVWRRGGGVSSFYVKVFLSHSAEKFRRGILYCCINFGYRKSSEKRRGEYQDIPSKIFCLTVPKISTGESFTVALISGIEKVWIRVGGGGESRYSIENFLPNRAENFRRGILYCCINFGYRKSLDKRGEGSIKNFHRKYFVSQCRKFP